MTFVTFTNILLSLLCIAVVIQSARIKRSCEAIRSGDLGQTVKQLDHATAQARSVLAELKQILATDGAATTRTIQSGESLRDELSVMVGIGNAVAERIMDAAASATPAASEPVEVEEPVLQHSKPQPLSEAVSKVQGPSTARKRSPRPSRLTRARDAAGVTGAPADVAEPLQVGIA